MCERERERGREGERSDERRGGGGLRKARAALGCVFNMQIEEMGLHHAVLVASVIFRAVPLPGLYPCDLPILILCKSTTSPLPSPLLSMAADVSRVLLMSLCFLPPSPSLCLARHERVPTFRFSINWLDYSSHSNQLARAHSIICSGN